MSIRTYSMEAVLHVTELGLEHLHCNSKLPVDYPRVGRIENILKTRLLLTLLVNNWAFLSCFFCKRSGHRVNTQPFPASHLLPAF